MLMKTKTILSSLMLALFFNVNAQLPNGSIAPNFTVTDIEGNQHNLNSYMSQGKVVLIDFFNALCSGCWYYHYHESLDKIYAAYGPEGTNQLVVLYVDGVCYEGLPEINGLSEYTYGDWVGHSNYPIVSTNYGCNLSDTYDIQAYPSLVKICPNGSGQGTLTNVSLSENPDVYLGYINSCITATSISNHVELFDSEIHLCASTNGKPRFKLRNLGLNPVTTATIKLYQNGTEISSQNYNGSLTRWDDVYIEFPTLALTSGGNYTAKITSINNTNPTNTNIAEATLNVETVNLYASNEILVDVATGYSGSQAEWKIKNSTGTIISQAGPFEDFAFGTIPRFHNQPTVTVPLQQNQCYTFTMYAIDGFPYSGQLQLAIDDPTVKRYKLKNPDNSSLYEAPQYPNFLDSQTVYFQTYGPVSVNELKNEFELSIYPIPVENELTIIVPIEGDFEISLSDEFGRILFTKKYENLTKNESILLDLSSFENGNYFLNTNNENIKFGVQKIVKI